MRLTRCVWVVKVSGKLCCDAALRTRFAAACAAHKGPLVVVHGGGVSITQWQDRLGYVPQFVEGRRVTPDDELPVVAMALAQVNQSLVQALLSAGRMAVGLTGADAGQIHCRRIAALGAVGVPQRVDPALAMLLVEAQLVPVLGPLCLDGAKLPVNVNADELACDVAGALGASRLIMLSDVAAVDVGGLPQQHVAVDDIEPLIASGDATGGMVPKLRSAARAVGQGVLEVRIGALGADLDGVVGTKIRGRS